MMTMDNEEGLEINESASSGRIRAIGKCIVMLGTGVDRAVLTIIQTLDIGLKKNSLQ